MKAAKRYLRWTFLSLLSGLLSGTGAAFFLNSIVWATQTRTEFPLIIWALPLAGFFIAYVYHHYGREVSSGNQLIFEEIHDPKKIIPFRMAPLVFGSTIVTHLFGGSTGREGAAVQIGASLSDQLSRFFKIEPAERKILLVSGAGASFGAAIGAPWAGIIFGMEVIHIGRLKLFALFECFIASFVAYYTTLFWGGRHSVFPSIEVDDFSFKTLFFILIAGMIFGLAARLFAFATHLVERINSKFSLYPPLKIFTAGVLLVLLFYLEGSYRYVGLGISSIQEALTTQDSFHDPIYKSFFTALSVGSGFKGGEFIPLVFVGTTLGSALAILLPVSFKLLAAVGFAAVFAGAANTPIACSIMAIEIFGFSIAPYAIIGCFASYYFSGPRGIYKAQKRLSRHSDGKK